MTTKKRKLQNFVDGVMSDKTLAEAVAVMNLERAEQRIERMKQLLMRAGACLANGDANEENAVVRDIFQELLGGDGYLLPFGVGFAADYAFRFKPATDGETGGGGK